MKLRSGQHRVVRRWYWVLALWEGSRAARLVACRRRHANVVNHSVEVYRVMRPHVHYFKTHCVTTKHLISTLMTVGHTG